MDAKGRIDDVDPRDRVNRHLMDSCAHGLTLARVIAETKGASGATNAASVLKASATHVAQTRAELTLEIMGHQGLGWEGDGFSDGETEAVRGWLFGARPCRSMAARPRSRTKSSPSEFSACRTPPVRAEVKEGACFDTRLPAACATRLLDLSNFVILSRVRSGLPKNATTADLAEPKPDAHVPS